jgi:hypothetical protein
MKNKHTPRISTTFLLIAFYSIAFSQVATVLPKKKLIDFGWNSPFTYELRQHLKKYEKAPFDGVCIKLPKGAGAGNIFMVKDLLALNEDSLRIEKKLMESMQQSKVLTHNFVVIYGGSQMDWFSDADWQVTEKQLRFAAQAAVAMHCKGLLWDAEPYKPGKNPWKYIEQQSAATLSYQQYYEQVKKRGRQFIQILQQEFPGLVLLSLREFSDFQQGSPFSEPMLPVKDINETEAKLKIAWWGLHLPFTLGILEAIENNTTFIDANEEAYYYTSAKEFYAVRDVIKNQGRALVPAALQQKFAANYSLGHAISSDYVCGNWANVISFPFRLSGQAKMLTPKQQALWFEHNAYYALKTADEYAWLYTEPSNWWTGENIPKGFEEALLRAKKKVINGEPLGFSVEEMLKAARIKAEKFQPEKKAK